MQEIDKSISFDGRDIRLKVGLLAPQAGGCVLIESGDTSVMVTATQGTGRPGLDFLPLLVDYEERMYAAGKIPGGFLRREGRPPEKATLTCRLIDRPMRPLFPQWIRDDIQIVATTLSLDENVPPDVLAVTGASIATLLAQIPFYGPMAAVRVGLVGDDFIINPTYAEIEEGELDLVVAGTAEGIIMVEAGAKELPEQDVIEAIDFGYEAVQDLLKAQTELLAELGITHEPPATPEKDTTIEDYVTKQSTKAVQKVIDAQGAKVERTEALDAIKAGLAEKIAGLKESDAVRVAYEANSKVLGDAFKGLTKKLMRQQVIKKNTRIDGRALDEVRKIDCQVGILPERVHGCGLFQRGLTQVMSIATLGTPGDAQMMDDLNPTINEKRYIHHYNFPPYSVGEARPMRSAGRREVGHGALAERALLPVLPSNESFPYVLRVVSEILSSDGSTSMGSVCGSTLALMNAGVPISKPVSGAAMGLIKEGDDVRILTDIQAIEDFLGDMDFKVAGTEDGITALQMDMKIHGLAMENIAEAIENALPARMHILGKMLEAIAEPAEKMSNYAPRLLTLKIPPEMIGMVIGPGGKMIKSITERTGAKVDIEDDGTVVVSAMDAQGAEQAYGIIEGMTRKVSPGDVYLGKVMRIIPIGAFVQFLPGKEGMIHISQLADYRVGKVEDEVSVGDSVVIKVREIDSRNRINLTRLGIEPEEEERVRAAGSAVV